MEVINIAIIDADLIGRKKHRFPNLASMKMSGYHKDIGDTVTLKTDYKNLDQFDHIYLSKVFTDTEVPEEVLKLENLSYGGTGFFYDKAPKLPDEIEHHFPDYHLYDEYVAERLEGGGEQVLISITQIILLALLQGVVLDNANSASTVTIKEYRRTVPFASSTILTVKRFAYLMTTS